MTSYDAYSSTIVLDRNGSRLVELDCGVVWMKLDFMFVSQRLVCSVSFRWHTWSRVTLIIVA